jgi:PKHD-type hydroxylase
VKFAAGDLVVYPASSLHRVEPITCGSRWASFFWAQSMVRDDGRRRLLYDLDCAIRDVRGAMTDEFEPAVKLAGVYHNLLRQWGEI